jgi:hypothetical protein
MIKMTPTLVIKTGASLSSTPTPLTFGRVVTCGFPGDEPKGPADINVSAGYVPLPGFSGSGGSPSVWVEGPNGNKLNIFTFGKTGDIDLVGNGKLVAHSSYQVSCLVPSSEVGGLSSW